MRAPAILALAPAAVAPPVAIVGYSYGIIALRPVPHGGLVAQEGGLHVMKQVFYRAVKLLPDPEPQQTSTSKRIGNRPQGNIWVGQVTL